MKDDKTRIIAVVTKDLKKELEEIAKKEDRSFSTLVNTILKDHVKK